MARLGLPIHSYSLRSKPASCARLMNCVAEALPKDAKSPVILVRVAGEELFVTVGVGPIRGLHFAFGKLFVVSGIGFYYVASDLSVTYLGDVGTGAVSMDHNTDTIVIVCAPAAYYTDGVTAPAQIIDPDFVARGASKVRFLDNYLLFLEPNSGRFFWADLASATSFNALNFATAEGSPDDLLGMETDHRQAVLFGEVSVEIWESTGDSAVFQRSVNGFIELGCFNGDTVAKLDNSLFWVANDYTVRRLNGTTPVRVSTHAVEQFLSTVTISSGSAFTYNQDGHFFYVLTFDQGTFVYDVTSGEWAERGSYGYDYWRWKQGATAFGFQLIGDSLSAVICKLNPLVYDENGTVQRMEWTYQPVYAENHRAVHRRLEVVLETGVGIITGQGSDPEMMMAYSDDGGITWTNLPTKKIGPMGQYTKRVHWERLGSARQRVYRGAISDPIKVVIADTQIEVEGAYV